MVSITTQDKALARSMEPRASAPEKRFDAIRRLAEAGVEDRHHDRTDDPRSQR